MDKCSIAGCSKRHYAKNLCRPHYDQSPARKQYLRDYAQTDKDKERQAKRRASPEVKAYMRAYRQREEVKARKNAKSKQYYSVPENHAKRTAYFSDPAVKARAATRLRTIEGLFGHAKHKSKGRELLWTLTLEEFSVLRRSPCAYCGSPLPEAGVGLDRLDNALGYSGDNVVPCCEVCNTARSDFFTYEEMVVLGRCIRDIRAARVSTSAGRVVE